jgi:hypothetical protein
VHLVAARLELTHLCCCPTPAAAAAAGLQGIASAPLYDSACGAVVGVISASDFIHTLRRLRNAVSSGSNPLSEAEMDAHTVRAHAWLHWCRRPASGLQDIMT